MFLLTGSNMGGAEMVVRNLMFNLDSNLFDLSLVSIRPTGIIGQEIKRKYPVYSLEANQKFNPLFLYKLYKILKQEKPDILHCHLFHANLVGRIIGKIAKVPYIISTIHSDNIGSQFRYFLLKISDFLNDTTVVVSNKVKQGLLERKIIAERKIKVIYNGVEEPDLTITENDVENKKRELKIENNYPIILSVGRLHSVKGHIYLIKAMKEVTKKYPKTKLVLIGDGAERQRLEDEVRILKIENNVLFLGEIKAEDIYYRLADMYIQPSLVEGFGITLVDAMKNNCFVIATNVGGIPEIIQDGVNGLLIESSSVDSLIFSIQKVVSLSKNEKENIINFKNKEDFLRKFYLYKMVESYQNNYK